MRGSVAGPVEVTIVGSGTLLPNDRRRSAGHFVRWSGGGLLMDCGSGVLHGLERDRLDWTSISHVALSHFHVDHWGDLPALLWAWKHGIPEEEQVARTLLGPPGLGERMELLARVHGPWILEPGAPLEVVELLSPGRWEDPEAGVTLQLHPARHTPEAMVLRVEVDGRSVGYTGDTGPDPDHHVFLHGVDVLIAECGAGEGDEAGIHLSPSQVAALARDVQPRVLVLTHIYPGVPRAGLADLMRELGVKARIVVASDGERVAVGR